MFTLDKFDITTTFYGPHPCDLCGHGPIIRGSVEQGVGHIRFEYPNEPIYPNHNWKEHKCSDVTTWGEPTRSEYPSPAVAGDDKELAQFIRDSTALKTKVEHKWTAWMSDREDGVVGTGETEKEAICALADAYREDAEAVCFMCDKPESAHHPTDKWCPNEAGDGWTYIKFRAKS